ncbi:hypothetical protein [Pseudobacteriovorax antillogorgiicola]|uniref:Uncharacterized protein n=1 Tax=Pseudobacteriovorax antillogorgiicola TaxID=1513793 RepID=A0A1Y6CH85_9BACT|nr:hypothetical protein [Pseudobacteriovorax antillogorgiicola]TCS47252.1 hypothetical protein EDD56_12125 [Pseudobacteriovorax antillogorgiicola]SMF62051.1 hypothetical protein SAMN06296036_12126 [Pseudobacteriovorax antillogorgiicola]
MDHRNRIRFKNRYTCVLEDLVMSLEHHVYHALEKNHVSPSELFYSLPNYDRFSNQFPKACHSCQKPFHSRDHYLKHTEPGEKPIEDGEQAVEYRICECGSPIILVAACRRDNNPFGMECRAYFDICVERLVSEQGFVRKEAEDLTRIIFQQVFEGVEQKVS